MNAELIRSLLVLRYRSQMALESAARDLDVHSGVFTGQVDNFLAGLDIDDEHAIHEIQHMTTEEIQELLDLVHHRNDEYKNTDDETLKAVLSEPIEQHMGKRNPCYGDAD